MAALTRRHVLRAGSVGLTLGVLGCTADDAPTDLRSPAPSPPPSPDELVRAGAAAAETSLLGTYAATALAHPDLAARLQTYAEHHRAHLDALAPTGTPTGDPTGRPAGDPTASTSAGPSAAATSPPVSVPPDPSAALASLGQAEAAAAAARTADCLAADDGELARLLASVAASEALHRDALAVR